MVSAPQCVRGTNSWNNGACETFCDDPSCPDRHIPHCDNITTKYDCRITKNCKWVKSAFSEKCVSVKIDGNYLEDKFLSEDETSIQVKN